MRKIKLNTGNIKIVLIFLAFALSIGLINAEASFQVSSFSCSPSEVTINSVFSCTARITNTGDASATLDVATLYTDTNNCLESPTYAQSSGATLNTSQSTEITFTGLRAVKSGNNGFSKIMLDSVERTDYVSTTKVNIINVVVSVTNSASSASMGGSVTSTAEVTAGGNVNVILSFVVDSGGCSIGSQTNPVAFNGMTDGSKQTKVWTITQGTGSSARDCKFSVYAAATGIGGIVSKISFTPSTITCTDCSTDAVAPSGGSSSSSGGAGGTGGAGSKIYIVGELTTPYEVQLLNGEKVKFNISGVEHTITQKNFTETTAVITVESEKQTFSIIVGNEINVDLNNDNSADINVKLRSINIIAKTVELILSKVSGGVPTKSIEQGGAGGGEKSPAAGGEKGISLDSRSLVIILIVIFVILGIVSAAYLIIRRRSR